MYMYRCMSTVCACLHFCWFIIFNCAWLLARTSTACGPNLTIPITPINGKYIYSDYALKFDLTVSDHWG